MRTLYKFGMLLNVIWVIDVLLRQEFNLAYIVVGLLGFSLSLQAIVMQDLRLELNMFKFLQEVNRVLVMNATHEELDELRRQLKSGTVNTGAKYARQLYEKYEKKDG